MPTTRQAWLVLPGRAPLYLDDHDAGYAMTELDLGYPSPREVTNNRPDADGVDDETALFGSRPVTANITAWAGGAMTIDDIAALFAPYLALGVRPELHYTRLSAAGAERVLTLRASAMTSPMGVPHSREMQLSWVAPDPIARGADLHSTVARTGSSSAIGREYPLAFPRIYPAGSGGPSYGTLVVSGDLPVWPTVRMFGPVDNPVIVFPSLPQPRPALELTTHLDGGDYVEVDMAARTAFRFTQSTGLITDAMGLVDWTQTIWLPVPSSTAVGYNGHNTTSLTQAVIEWHDRYLT